MDITSLKLHLKELIINECDKSDILAATDLQDDEPLFGNRSRLNLDSLDALQIAVALKQHFNIDLKGGSAIRKHMKCVADLSKFIEKNIKKDSP